MSKKRVTVTAYGTSEDDLHSIVAVLHNAKTGKMYERSIFYRDDLEDLDKVTDEIVELAARHGADIVQLNEVLSPESCPHCGGAVFRVVTDEDLRRAEP